MSIRYRDYAICRRCNEKFSISIPILIMIFNPRLFGMILEYWELELTAHKIDCILEETYAKCD